MKRLTLILSILIISNFLSAQWEVIYPDPFLDGFFRDIFFVDENHGWVAGSDGMIMYTPDGGINWEIQTTPGSMYFYAIHFGNENTGWAGGLLKTTDHGLTWTVVPSFPGTSVRSIYSIGDDTCWAGCGGVSDGQIYFTSDGGNSWTTQYSGGPIYCLSFINDSCGWATGKNGTILSTTNGGSVWEILPNLNGGTIKKTCFTSLSTGYALMDVFFEYDTLFKTTDGGLSWEAILRGDIRDMDFQNADTGFALLGHRSYRTLDGGTTWVSQTFPIGNCEVDGCIFNDFNKVWLSSGFNPPHIYYSDDLGEDYVHAFPEVPTLNGLNALDFSDEMNGWAVGDLGTMVYTNDGGDSWLASESITTDKLTDVQFAGNGVGYAVGDSGTVLKTQNNGDDWSVLNPGFDDNFIELSFVDENTGWLISDSLLIKTMDSGMNWEIVAVPDSVKPFHAIELISETECWLQGKHELYHTLDGGASWEVSFSGDKFTWGENSIHFSDGLHGFVGFGYGGLHPYCFLIKTYNGGQTWQEILYMDFFISMDFYDNSHGFVLGMSGLKGGQYIEETLDGGRNWNASVPYPFNTLTLSAPLEIGFSDPNHAHIIGTGGLIMKWTDPAVSVREPMDKDDPGLSIYPNPTSGVSSFRFQVSPARTTDIVQSGMGSNHITLKIYDLHGREVATVIDQSLPVGEHTVSFDVNGLPAGVYVWRQLAVGSRQLAVGKLIKF